MWNPNTGNFTVMAPEAEPRNYHSAAVLLPDDRVFSGGSACVAAAPPIMRTARSTHLRTSSKPTAPCAFARSSLLHPPPQPTETPSPSPPIYGCPNSQLSATGNPPIPWTTISGAFHFRSCLEMETPISWPSRPIPVSRDHTCCSHSTAGARRASQPGSPLRTPLRKRITSLGA